MLLVNKCESFFVDMCEPYVNREKQYLKMNAELDNRFKEIDSMKSNAADVVKPRLNIFGNSSKVNNLTTNVVALSKVQKSEIKGGTTPTGSSHGLSPKNLGDTARSFKNTTSQDLNACATNKDDQNSFLGKKLADDENKNLSVVTTVALSHTVKKNISSDGLIKFLKSKVAILKQELEQIQQENVKSLRAYEGSVESNKKNIAQINQLTNENAALKIQIEKLQHVNTTQETLLKEKDADLATMNREMVSLEKQLKEVTRLHNVLDKRFSKCQDDMEHLRKNLNNSQESERQQRAINQHQKNFFEGQIKILRNQRTGLISAYKKQLLLLDNLKRQNLCLEQSKLLQLAEKDFMKILDWKNE